MANKDDSKLQLPQTWPPPQERPNDKSVPGPARFKSSELHWTGSVKLFFSNNVVSQNVNNDSLSLNLYLS